MQIMAIWKIVVLSSQIPSGEDDPVRRLCAWVLGHSSRNESSVFANSGKHSDINDLFSLKSRPDLQHPLLNRVTGIRVRGSECTREGVVMQPIRRLYQC